MRCLAWLALLIGILLGFLFAWIFLFGAALLILS